MKTVLLLSLLPAALAAQSVEGDVYDALTGAPLAGVTVNSGQNSSTRTDASGHFHLSPPGQVYQLVVAKAGYITTYKQPVNSPAVHIDLKPEAVITGKIVDEDGFPAGGAHVQAMRYRTINGRRQLMTGAWTESDERGEYRIDNLAAGRYYLLIFSNDAFNWDSRFVSQYLGGTIQPDDKHSIEVKMGETRKDVDGQLARFEGVTVTGRVEAVANGSRPAGQALNLTSRSPAAGRSATGFLDRDMNFTIRHVPPGTYTLRFGSYPPKAGDLLAQVPLEVADQDVRNLVVTPHVVQAIDLQGQVKLREGGSPGGWYVYLRPQMGYGVSAHSEDDGSFAAKGLLPEHYAVQVTPDRSASLSPTPSKGHVVSITLGDLDVSDTGFDLDGTPQQKPLIILVSNRYALLSGTAVDAQGAPIANASIYFQNVQTGRPANAATDGKGNFRAMLDEPGDYHVFVVDRDVMDSQGQDEYLNAHLTDFPVIHAVLGDNPPLRLVRSPTR